MDDAYEALGLSRGQHHPEPVIRKAYYRLAQKLHPDKNPHGRVCRIYIFINVFTLNTLRMYVHYQIIKVHYLTFQMFYLLLY